MKQPPNILQNRARCLRQIREFFYQREVLEVETPSLATYSVTDPYMSAMLVTDMRGTQQGFLQTSPEYAMKKLLCAGSDNIFQLGKVYRADENGPRHSAEFTMLEWYRKGFNEWQLMTEVEELLVEIIGPRDRVDYSYRTAFQTFTNIDPFTISLSELARYAHKQLGDLPPDMLFDNYLSLIFSERVESGFDREKLTFVYDFPASQSALAKTRKVDGIGLAHRFEVYSGGLELANGFYELTDAEEQRERFEEDNQIRERLGSRKIAIDHEFIAALKKGLPDCSGVALGFDRLLMIRLGETQIKKVLPMAFCQTDTCSTG